MRTPLVLSLAALAVAVAPASANTGAAPKDCGLSPSKYLHIYVDKASTCAFGVATWRALKAYSNTHAFPSAVEKNFVLVPSTNGHRVTLDCRALARAHGEFDYYCNNLNRRGTHVVQMDTTMEP